MHEGRELVNFASYDYLGLNQEPAVAEAAKAAIDECGTSVSASRLVAGERMLHRELEQELAEFYGSDACLTFVSGHATNVSTIGMLMGPGDLIVQDELSLRHDRAVERRAPPPASTRRRTRWRGIRDEGSRFASPTGGRRRRRAGGGRWSP